MSGNLRNNMIAGAVLGSVLGLLGLSTIADGFVASHYSEKPGYPIALPEAPAGGGAVAQAPKPIDWGVILGDAAALPALVAQGEKIHAQCKSCHSFDSGGPNGTGPNLYGVVGRTSGTHAGFEYSEAMAAHAKPWTYDELSRFIAGPAAYIRGTKMAFAGVKKDPDRIALIAYLRSLSPSPAPVPAPLPPEAAPAPTEASAAEAPAPT